MAIDSSISKLSHPGIQPTADHIVFNILKNVYKVDLLSLNLWCPRVSYLWTYFTLNPTLVDTLLKNDTKEQVFQTEEMWFQFYPRQGLYISFIVRIFIMRRNVHMHINEPFDGIIDKIWDQNSCRQWVVCYNILFLKAKLGDLTIGGATMGLTPKMNFPSVRKTSAFMWAAMKTHTKMPVSNRSSFASSFLELISWRKCLLLSHFDSLQLGL